MSGTRTPTAKPNGERLRPILPGARLARVGQSNHPLRANSRWDVCIGMVGWPSAPACYNPFALLSCSAMQSQSPIVLDIRDLTKRFDDVVAVDGLSFRIARGEIVGILGANGAGKTTTLQMILGLIRPTSGRIEVFGLDHERHRIDILRRMNFSSVGVSLP